jgi:uncharacterized protein DUF6755
VTTHELRAQRGQQVTVLHAVMTCLVVLVSLQCVLLAVAVEGFLAGHGDLLWPATLASGVCFVAACCLIRQAPGRLGAPRAKGASNT